MTEFAQPAASGGGGSRFRQLLLFALLAFAAGAIATWWLADRYGWFDSPLAARPAPVAPGAAPPVVAPIPYAGPATPLSGNGDSLLVAVATRRAIENGGQLGALADQLRQRFGSSQPQAVVTVLQAAQTPVSVASLRAELAALQQSLVTANAEANLWTRLSNELSQLFVLRRGGEAALPNERWLRATAFAESGNFGAAIAEVAAMPGANSVPAQNWLRRARNMEQTLAALDRLEGAALNAPPATETPPPAPIMPAPSPEQPLPDGAAPQ
jgi:hypothetical protein